MAGKMYIAMILNPGYVTLNEQDAKINLPPRCAGVLMVFETKTAARAFSGRNCPLLPISVCKED